MTTKSLILSATPAVRPDGVNSLLTLAGRLLIGPLFLISGLLHLSDPAGTIGYIAFVGLPFPPLAFAGSLLLGMGGALLLMVGYYTRLAALALVLYTLITALVFHMDFGNPEELMQFFKNFALAGGLLQIIVLGAGAYSLDNRRR